MATRLNMLKSAFGALGLKGSRKVRNTVGFFCRKLSADDDSVNFVLKWTTMPILYCHIFIFEISMKYLSKEIKTSLCWPCLHLTLEVLKWISQQFIKFWNKAIFAVTVFARRPTFDQNTSHDVFQIINFIDRWITWTSEPVLAINFKREYTMHF